MHQVNIFGIAVVVIHGHVGGLAALDLAGLVDKGVPDGGTLAVLVPGAFDLIGGRNGAPNESFRKIKPGHFRCS